jgi:hypothetical protein
MTNRLLQVVPTFYSVYTGAGFLLSLVFNNEIDAYNPWALALVFLSILVLIGGVVLLTNDKPDPNGKGQMKMKQIRTSNDSLEEPRDSKVGRGLTEAERENEPRGAAVWELGNDSDDDDDDSDARKPGGSGIHANDKRTDAAPSGPPRKGERAGLMESHEDDEDDRHPPAPSHSPSRHSSSDEEFGDWEDGSKPGPTGPRAHR